MRVMRFACWITKATDTHSEYVICIAFFHGNNGYANAPQSHAINKLPVLFSSRLFRITAARLMKSLSCGDTAGDPKWNYKSNV
jgi:hypothetical protein